METILMTAACLALGAAYVAWSRRRDRLADREHQAIIMAMTPGPRVRELTRVRPNPLRTRKIASGSQPVDFGHSPTDYGTYTPAQIDAAILGRADADAHYPHATPCAEAPPVDVGHHVSHHDTCSTVDTSYGGFDGGGHHGH